MKTTLSTIIAFILTLSMLTSAYFLSRQSYYNRITPAAEIKLLKTELALERYKNKCFEEVIRIYQEEKK